MNVPQLKSNLYSIRGLAAYSIKNKLSNLIQEIEKQGLSSAHLHEIKKLLRNLGQPYETGISPIEGYYVMDVKEKNSVYKNSIDHCIDCEILGDSIADAIFETMKCILENVYDLRIMSRKYKCEIFNDLEKIGDMFYDMENGVVVQRLRAVMVKRIIVVCWNNEGFIINTRLRFGPKKKSRIIRKEVLPVLIKKQKEFETILALKPKELFHGLMNVL